MINYSIRTALGLALELYIKNHSFVTASFHRPWINNSRCQEVKLFLSYNM